MAKIFKCGAKRMKQKYIMGDLVKYNLEDKKQVVEVISYAHIYKRYFLTNEYINETRGCISVIEDKITPIHLTKKILEKNGWKRTQIFIDDDGLEFHTYIDDERCLDLQYYPQYKKFAAFICKQEVLSDIKYVHQLQHLLFGLGLNLEMEV